MKVLVIFYSLHHPVNIFLVLLCQVSIRVRKNQRPQWIFLGFCVGRKFEIMIKCYFWCIFCFEWLEAVAMIYRTIRFTVWLKELQQKYWSLKFMRWSDILYFDIKFNARCEYRILSKQVFENSIVLSDFSDV